jgi:hypothetical protein
VSSSAAGVLGFLMPGTRDVSEQIEREIERAWIVHEPDRARSPHEVWRKLRVHKKQFEPTSSKIRAALLDEASLQSLVIQCCRRRGVARQRILADTRRSFPGAAIKIAHKNVLEISWITPSPPVIVDPKDHSERQECTLVCYCVAWPSPFGVRLWSSTPGLGRFRFGTLQKRDQH